MTAPPLDDALDALVKALRRRDRIAEAMWQRCDMAADAITALRAQVARLSEAWIDDGGNVWCPPTAWAYAQLCRVRRELQARAEKAEAALRAPVPAEVEAWVRWLRDEDEEPPSGSESVSEFLERQAREIVRVTAERDAAGKDAERYRKIVDKCAVCVPPSWMPPIDGLWPCRTLTGDQIAPAIDAALAAAQEGAQTDQEGGR